MHEGLKPGVKVEINISRKASAVKVMLPLSIARENIYPVSNDGAFFRRLFRSKQTGIVIENDRC